MRDLQGSLGYVMLMAFGALQYVNIAICDLHPNGIIDDSIFLGSGLTLQSKGVQRGKDI